MSTLKDSEREPTCWDWLAIAVLLSFLEGVFGDGDKLSSTDRLRRIISGRPTSSHWANSHWANIQPSRGTSATYCRLYSEDGALWLHIFWPPKDGYAGYNLFIGLPLDPIRVGLDWLDEHP
jgi:hypothetical protein